MAIVSVSRRTDIPAFYTEWFINRIYEGYVLYPLPHSEKLKYLELNADNVDCFVFWSKNYEHLIPYLKMLDNRGFEYYFHFTVNNYPDYLEYNVVKGNGTIDQFKILADHKSPEHVLWRYDPIIITKDLNINYHLYNFESIAAKLEGYTKRCYLEFVDIYKKVERNFTQKEINYVSLPQDKRQYLFNSIANIAKNYGIDVYSCCNDSLISGHVNKARCIDSDLIMKLTNKQINYNFAPTRKECGCAKSIDIGEYGSCLHGCLYCYANDNMNSAQKFYDNYDVSSPALDKNKLSKFDNLNLVKNTHKDDGQLKLF